MKNSFGVAADLRNLPIRPLVSHTPIACYHRITNLFWPNPRLAIDCLQHLPHTLGARAQIHHLGRQGFLIFSQQNCL